MIGNSSSGLTEGPSFKIPVVNIGDRQKGRIKAENIIDVACEVDAIRAGIEKATSSEFRQSIQDIRNPYDKYADGRTSLRIKETLKTIQLSKQLMQKRFHDIDFGVPLMNENFSNLLVTPDTKIRNAMNQLEVTEKRILFVVDEGRKLLGTLTDGDIRRWILAEGELDDTIAGVYNKNPFYVESDYDAEQTRKMMLERNISCVPVVDGNGKIGQLSFLGQPVRRCG